MAMSRRQQRAMFAKLNSPRAAPLRPQIITIKMLDKIAKKEYGEFGYDTLDDDEQKQNVLNIAQKRIDYSKKCEVCGKPSSSGLCKEHKEFEQYSGFKKEDKPKRNFSAIPTEDLVDETSRTSDKSTLRHKQNMAELRKRRNSSKLKYTQEELKLSREYGRSPASIRRQMKKDGYVTA